ncbi:hypothetical protein [Streptomyces sp. NPDC001970]
MNKNIRRSIVVAAGAAGMWAIGTAAASADELPSLSLSTPDQGIDVLDTVEDTVTGATDAADDVPAVAAATGTAQAGAGAAVAQAEEAKGAAQDATRAPVVSTADQARQYAEGELSDAQGEIDYLFGPLSSFAPELVDQAPGAAQGYARGAVAAATPIADETCQDVLPPIADRAVDGVLPVAGQAVGDVAGLATGVVGEVTPFAGGVVSEVQPFAGSVVGEVQPFAGGVVGEVQPLVETVVDHVEPVAYGVGGSAGNLAHGVVGDVRPFAGGVVSEVRPFAQDVTGTVAGTPVAGNAVSGVQDVAYAVTPSYVDSLGHSLTQGI